MTPTGVRPGCAHPCFTAEVAGVEREARTPEDLGARAIVVLAARDLESRRNRTEEPRMIHAQRAAV